MEKAEVRKSIDLAVFISLMDAACCNKINTCLNDDLGFINVLLTSAIKHGNSDYVEGFLQTEFDFTEEESKNYVQELIKKYGHLVDVSEMSENPKP